MWAQPDMWIQGDMCAEFKIEPEFEFVKDLEKNQYDKIAAPPQIQI
jgi:hypothetical protein